MPQSIWLLRGVKHYSLAVIAHGESFGPGQQKHTQGHTIYSLSQDAFFQTIALWGWFPHEDTFTLWQCLPQREVGPRDQKIAWLQSMLVRKNVLNGNKHCKVCFVLVIGYKAAWNTSSPRFHVFLRCNSSAARAQTIRQSPRSDRSVWVWPVVIRCISDENAFFFKSRLFWRKFQNALHAFFCCCSPQTLRDVSFCQTQMKKKKSSDT